MPVMFNASILNGMGLIGYVKGQPTWHPNNDEKNLLSIHFSYSKFIWPWTSYLALHMQIKDEGAQFSGLIEGNVTVNIFSLPPPREKGQRRTITCVLQLKLKVVPTLPRAKSILWDQYHSIKYPPRYIPRDSLEVRNDILDWHGDYLHTNFHVMLNMLRDSRYCVETLGSPLTCFDVRQYWTLLMVDLEDEYFKEEIEKLRDDILNAGLGLVVFAECRYASRTDKVKFPEGGFVHSFPFLDSSESGATQNVLQTSGLMKEVHLSDGVLSLCFLQFDMQVLLPSQWIIPIIVAIFGTSF
ncbi:hypothetical protein GIB67_020518 [Kingdonia uniflora]|uniref:Uncharacterized protein n=1 Tax=Kingdonia uniflora TaxID=39325 RepID=A0A7J7LD79_9MAGN|nr:hypothetical protein GIB67_020518 [Kingdonia uniflora]